MKQIKQAGEDDGDRLPVSGTSDLYFLRRDFWTNDFFQVGGLLGLCLGFSFCSGVEILYWFLVR